MRRSTAQSRSQHVLPDICVLCQKEKTITCRITRKWKKEHLVKCSTIDAVNLKQAAEDNKNETLLMQIKDKDCVNKITPATLPNHNDTSCSLASEVFCEKVKSSVIENKDIMRLKTLNDIFTEQVKLTHGKEADSYKTGNLKTRIIKKFSQLCFITPRMKSQSEYMLMTFRQLHLKRRRNCFEMQCKSLQTERKIRRMKSSKLQHRPNKVTSLMPKQTNLKTTT